MRIHNSIKRDGTFKELGIPLWCYLPKRIRAVTRCLWSSPTNLCLWMWGATLAHSSTAKISTKSHLRDTSVLRGLHCIFKCVAQLQPFLLFLSVLSFGLLYGSFFYNEVVLCDDQKLWCSSIVFKYLMSLQYGLKSVWTSGPAVSIFIQWNIVWGGVYDFFKGFALITGLCNFATFLR